MHMYTSIHRYTQVYTAIHRYTPQVYRYTQVYTGIHSYTPVYNTGIHQYTPVYTGIHSYTRIHRYTQLAIHRYTLVYTSVHRYSTAHFKLDDTRVQQLHGLTRFQKCPQHFPRAHDRPMTYYHWKLHACMHETFVLLTCVA